MPFIRNLWYVAAWGQELDGPGPIGRTGIGEPIVLFRTPDGAVRALEDRCPHRHAPLSFGRVEGERLRCMYHGLTFSPEGVCSWTGSDHCPARPGRRAPFRWSSAGTGFGCGPATRPAPTRLRSPRSTIRTTAIGR